MTVTEIKKVIDKSLFIMIIVFLSLLISLLISNFVTDQTNYQGFCPITTEKEQSTLEKDYLLTNYENVEISVLPKIKNIFCLGKFQKVDYENEIVTKYIYSSSNLYSILNFLGSFLIFIYFINKKNRYKFVTTLATFNLLNMILFYNVKVHPQFFYKYLLIFIVILAIFFKIHEIDWELKLFDVATIFITLLMFSNYQTFINVFLVYFIIFFFNDEFIKESNLFKYSEFIKAVPLIFFFVRIVTSLNSNFNFYWRELTPEVFKSYMRFGDMQLVVNTVKCNFSNIYIRDEPYNFLNSIHQCPFKTGYPLIDNNISLNIQNIWMITLVVSVFLIAILSLQYLKLIKDYESNKFLILLLFISPPFNFLIERMNIDILILIISLFILKSENLNIYITSALIIFTATLKIFTFPLILSFFLYALLSKNKKEIIIYGIGSALLISYLITYSSFGVNSTFSQQSFFSDIMSNPVISFGLLSSSVYFQQFFDVLDVKIFYLLNITIVCFLFFLISRLQKINFSSHLNYNILFMPVLILIFLYENLDYRITFFLLLLPLILSSKSNLITFGYFILIFTSATNFILLNTTIQFLNIFLQLFFLAYCISIYLKLLSNKLKNRI